MRLSFAAARKCVLVIGMHILVAISMHLQCSNGNIIHTLSTFQIQITAGLSDAVYLIECFPRLPARGYYPLLFARSFILHAKTEMIIVCFVPSEVGLPHLSGSWPSRVVWKAQGASAHAIFVTREHKSTNLTSTRSLCDKQIIHNDRKEVCAYLKLCSS